MPAELYFRQWLRGVLEELSPDTIELSLREVPGRVWARDELTAYCPRCGASGVVEAMTPRGCAFCVGERLVWDRLYRLGLYEEPLAGWVRASKFAGDWRRALWFGGQLGEAIGSPTGGAPVAVVPVPMHWARRWRRGYNQARLIADGLVRARGWPMVDVLHRPRRRPPQTAVLPEHRGINVADSFAIEPIDLSGWEVVLVDDVKTSGATLSACGRLLREAGAKSIVAAVAAVADPRGRGFGVKGRG
ncbi:ComF family protein [Phycisphaerales bacterium AB-hyl4]|uniref:ComF family protein n=1 Tax=Natronomicrosphaera hydrolytica TaxID=3242702 RepID=A0ABV4TZM9_9BACT